MESLLELVIGADGQMRRNDEAIRVVVGEARRDAALGDLVRELDDRPAAFGAFGMLIGARLRSDGSRVLVKVNASPTERAWLPAIHAVDPTVAPGVFGSGDRTGDLALGWLALEWLPHQPPGFGGPGWYEPLMTAATRWQRAAAQLDLPPVHTIDGEWTASWLDVLLRSEPTPELRRLRDRFDEDWAWVTSRCPMVASHGDVHFFNAGSRSEHAPDALVLFDPIPRLAPWPYDAANCHTLTNYHLRGADRSLVELVADHRRSQGLATPEPADVRRISALFCGWLAVMWRTVFGDVQAERAATVGAYVAAALAT
jgi:hypothetical protein